MSNTRAPGRRYNFADHGQEGTGYAGDYILQPVSYAKKYTPTFGNLKQTTVRLLPVRNPEDPSKWENFRIDTGAGGYTWGDWIRGYQVCRMGEGDQSVSFITHDPIERDQFDPMNSPPWVLYNSVQRRVKAKTDPGWGGYLVYDGKRGAALAPPKMAYFMNVLIMEHKDGVCQPTIGIDDDGVATILQLTKAAGDSMLRQAEQTVQGYQGDPNNFAASLVHGDLTALSHGGFVTFYSKADGDPRTRQQQQQQASWANQANQPAGTKDIGYGCYIEPTFRGLPGDISVLEQMLTRKTYTWEQLINIPSPEQQAAWLADRFPPDMILFAFQAHPTWIPEGVRAKAAAAISVAPGFVPISQPNAAQWPPQGMQPAPQQPQQWSQPPYQQPDPAQQMLPQGNFGAQGYVPPGPLTGQPSVDNVGNPTGYPAAAGFAATGVPFDVNTPPAAQAAAISPATQPPATWATGTQLQSAPMAGWANAGGLSPAVPVQNPAAVAPQQTFGAPPQQTFGTPPQLGQAPAPQQFQQPPQPAQFQQPQQPQQFQPQPQPQQQQYAPIPQGTTALGNVPAAVAPADVAAKLAQLRANAGRV